MDIDAEKIKVLEEELEKTDTNVMIRITFNILAKKHNLKHRLIFALIHGISLEKLVDMLNLIINNETSYGNWRLGTRKGVFPNISGTGDRYTSTFYQNIFKLK